jgi:hypothetical protein
VEGTIQDISYIRRQILRLECRWVWFQIVGNLFGISDVEISDLFNTVLVPQSSIQ